MDEKTRIVQHDFDRLALYETEEWTHNRHYSDYLLKQMPAPCRSACEVGCGSGELARKMAERADSVLALDLSPVMIDQAKVRSGGYTNINYVVADVMSYDFPPHSFDFIVSVATLHHMDAEAVFERLKQALAPGGVLAVLDLYQAESLADYVTGAVAIPVDALSRVFYRGYIKQPEAVRMLWDEHGKHDSYLTLAQVRKICNRVLTGAVVRRHLLWRYSLLWKKLSS